MHYGIAKCKQKAVNTSNMAATWIFEPYWGLDGTSSAQNCMNFFVDTLQMLF